MKLRSKIWLEKDGRLVFGSGRELILKTIAKTGSLSKAAQQLNMSFRRVWSYINSTENRLGINLLDKVKGGKGGGGSVLTPYARDLLEKFEKLDQEIKKFADKKYKEIFKEIKKGK